MKAGYFYSIFASLITSFVQAQVMPVQTSYYTNIVKDIFPGLIDSSPSNLVDVNGTLFFSAKASVIGRELWKTDGTQAGTVLVKDINVDDDSDPGHTTNFNGLLIFSAIQSSYGRELWKSDGTAAGTVMIKNINPNGSSDPWPLKIIGNTLFFLATNTANGRELWKTDGTSAGTVLVKDMSPGSASTFGIVENTHVLNSELYFSLGNELWKSDGTSAGTLKIHTFSYFQKARDVRLLKVVGQKLFFFSSFTDPAAPVPGLWFVLSTWDGATGIVQTIKAEHGLGVPNIANEVANGLLFFVLTHPSTGMQLWSSNGNGSGTSVVKNINPSGDDRILNLVSFKNKAYFSAKINSSDTYLCESDGTAAGTKTIKKITPEYITVANNKLFFTTFEVPYFSDGTAAGTKKLIFTESGDMETPYPIFTASGSKVFYSARIYGVVGFELFKATPCTTCPVPASQTPVGNLESAAGLRLESRGNPVTDEITAEIGVSDAEKITLTLTNSAGRVLETRLLKGNFSEIQTFDVRSYPPGMYLVNASTLREQKVLKVLKSN